MIIALISETFRLLNQKREDYNYTEELNQRNEEIYVEIKFDEWYKNFEGLK